MLLLAVIERTGGGHGYAIISALREMSCDGFDLSEGTVYPLLHRMERDGLLASSWDQSTGRKRKTYLITAEGLKALHGQRQSWFRYVQTVRLVLGGVEIGPVTP